MQTRPDMARRDSDTLPRSIGGGDVFSSSDISYLDMTHDSPLYVSPQDIVTHSHVDHMATSPSASSTGSFACTPASSAGHPDYNAIMASQSPNAQQIFLSSSSPDVKADVYNFPDPLMAFNALEREYHVNMAPNSVVSDSGWNPESAVDWVLATTTLKDASASDPGHVSTTSAPSSPDGIGPLPVFHATQALPVEGCVKIEQHAAPVSTPAPAVVSVDTPEAGADCLSLVPRAKQSPPGAHHHALVLAAPRSTVSSSPVQGYSSSAIDESSPGDKVDEPYAKLLYRAFMTRPDHCMTLQELYQWFREHTTKAVTELGGWQNSIRHNLSMNLAFKKRDKSAHGRSSKYRESTSRRYNEWYLEPWAVIHGVQSTTRYRKGTCARRGSSGRASSGAWAAGHSAKRAASGSKGGCATRASRQRRQIDDLMLREPYHGLPHMMPPSNFPLPMTMQPYMYTPDMNHMPFVPPTMNYPGGTISNTPGGGMTQSVSSPALAADFHQGLVLRGGTMHHHVGHTYSCDGIIGPHRRNVLVNQEHNVGELGSRLSRGTYRGARAGDLSPTPELDLLAGVAPAWWSGSQSL